MITVYGAECIFFQECKWSGQRMDCDRKSVRLGYNIF